MIVGHLASISLYVPCSALFLNRATAVLRYCCSHEPTVLVPAFRFCDVTSGPKAFSLYLIISLIIRKDFLYISVSFYDYDILHPSELGTLKDQSVRVSLFSAASCTPEHESTTVKRSAI